MYVCVVEGPYAGPVRCAVLNLYPAPPRPHTTRQTARFLQEVVVELLLRDVSSLLEVYLRRMRKSFARMTYDLEDEDDDRLID